MFVLVSGPSGSGKTTIINAVIENLGNETIALLPSSTRRKIRPGEVEGKYYFYLTPEEFEKEIEKGDFIEYQKVFENGNYYGVSRSRYNEYSKVYPVLIKDVDVLGVKAIKNEKNIDSLSIYIDVETEELKQRLKERGETAEEISVRLKRKNFEDEFKNQYDYVFENKNLQKAIKDVTNCVKNELNKRKMQ